MTAQKDEYALNQLVGWENAIGVTLVGINLPHLKRGKAKFIQLFGDPTVDVDLDALYDTSLDPIVHIVLVSANDGVLIDGETINVVLLDTGDKRNLGMMRTLLYNIGFTIAEVAWPANRGGFTASYFVKRDGTVAEAIAFCDEFELPYTNVV